MIRCSLEDINQWNDVNHVVLNENGHITCLVCNAGPMPTNNASSHFNGQSHEKKYRYMTKHLDYLMEIEYNLITCKLCNTGPMTKRTVFGHLNGKTHRKNLKSSNAQKILSVLRDLKKRNYRVPNLLPRINQLGFSRWRYDSLSLLYTFITHTTSANYEITAQCLAKYERMEITSLLELAIVKYTVCTDTGFSSMQEVYDYNAHENGFDQHAFLRSQRITCGSNVIIPLVMKYL